MPGNLFTGHHDLDRPSGLAGEDQCHRLEIDQRLAAEPAADLGRRHSDTGHVDTEQFGAIGADRELALAAGPDLHLAVGCGRDNASVRLDIGLMHGLGGILALDDHVGLAKARRDVALRKANPLGDVGGLFRLGVDALREEIVMQQRGAVGHRLLNVNDVWQHFVLDLDQFECSGRIGRVPTTLRLCFLVSNVMTGSSLFQSVAGIVISHHIYRQYPAWAVYLTNTPFRVLIAF